jgi:hypothetical protein
MITLDQGMKKRFSLFREQFHDIVPLVEISRRVTSQQLINAIKRSIEAEEPTT